MIIDLVFEFSIDFRFVWACKIVNYQWKSFIEKLAPGCSSILFYFSQRLSSLTSLVKSQLVCLLPVMDAGYVENEICVSNAPAN